VVILPIPEGKKVSSDVLINNFCSLFFIVFETS